MALTSLLEEHKQVKAKRDALEESIKEVEKTLEVINKCIAGAIGREFGEFIADINMTLPDDKKVTEWRVQYNSISPTYINITKIGRKAYRNDAEMSREDPLPEYLRSVKSFAESYPVKILFRLINHSYLDVPLSELK